jgi:glycosyltransferase involved in cell wall biosynthesis
MMKQFMISIVIPALNEEEYLPDCLESLKKQQWAGEREIIVVDNGSSDGTARVAALGGARVVVCAKRGVAFARQAGAEAARGDIVAQADADTMYPPHWLGRIDNFFASHADAAGLGGRYVYAQSAWWAPVERGFRRGLNRVGFLFLRWPASVSGANVAFRRAALVKAGGYDPTSLYADQWGIARRASRFGRVHYDHTLVVTTSARRVAKPIYVIVYEIVRNCGHVGAHFVRHCLRQLGMSAGKPAGT